MNAQLPADLSIPAFLDRRKLIYTYSMLNAYKNCGHSMFRRYIKKDIPYVQSPEAKWGDEVHQAFEYRVGGGKPLPQNMQAWEQFARPFDGRGALVEQKLGITKTGQPTGFWDNDCWFRGKVDLAIVNGAKAYILDWKSGNSKYEDPFELEVGALLLKAKHREIEFISGSYCWLKENRLGQGYDLSKFRDTWNEINRLVGKIEADRALNEFEKKQSGLCKGWCSVTDCEFNQPKQVQ